MRGFSYADYIVFGGMLILSVVIGLFKRAPKGGNAEQFLTGGGDMNTGLVALSMLAGFLSSITLIGQPAEVYLYGAQQWLFGIATFLVIPIVGYKLAPFFRRNKFFSAYQYFGVRFNRKFQCLASTLFTFQMVVYMASVVYAPALAMNQVTGLNTMAVVSVMFLVCIIYTSLGGVKAVIWADSFQVIVLFVSLITIVVKGTVAIGGVDVVWERNSAYNRTQLFNFNFSLTERYTFWSSLIGAGFLHMSTYGGNQLQIQRYFSVRTDQQARKMLWINTVGWSIVVLICVYLGLLIFAHYVDCDPLRENVGMKPDQIFPLYVMDTLGDYPGFPGLFISGVFSAGLSTVSTGMNSLAAIWFAELEGTEFKKNLTASQSGLVVKLFALCFGIISYLIVFLVPYMGGLVQLAVSLSSTFAGSLLGIFLLGIVFPKSNTLGAFAGLLSSIGVLCFIAVGSAISVREGKIVHPSLPTSIEGCSGPVTAKLLQEAELAPTIYRISYLWMSLIAFIITTVVGNFVSIVTNLCTRSDPNQINNPNELAIHDLLLNKELKVIPKIVSK